MKKGYFNTNLRKILPIAIVVVAIFILYVPVISELLSGVWASDKQGHGPIVLLVALWFFYFKTQDLVNSPIIIKPRPVLGWAILLVGAVSYAIGKSQSFYVFEVGSLIPIILGIIVIFFGLRVSKHYWFAFFFLIFTVPWPASLVDAITQPMKIAVSISAEHVLYALDYPIARSGVILMIGQYQLLVADACSGLNSLFTLEALGLLYINVIKHESPLRNLLLAVCIVPISFISNVTRVLTLSLITFYLGNEAGQGFLHQFSGMVLFITALILIMSLDSFFQFIQDKRSKLRALKADK